MIDFFSERKRAFKNHHLLLFAQARKIRGWVAKPLACDFIAYAFIQSQTCYLLPFQTLRRAWRDNCKQWVRDHKRVRAENNGYVTISVAVPTKVLMEALSDAIKIQWKTAA